MLEKITLIYSVLRARAHENARARTNVLCACSGCVCYIKNYNLLIINLICWQNIIISGVIRSTMRHTQPNCKVYFAKLKKK